METIGMFLSLILTNNVIMQGVKWLSISSQSVIWLRGVLLALSAFGIIATAALTGNPIDFNNLSGIGKSLLEMVIVFVGSHYSYKVLSS